MPDSSNASLYIGLMSGTSLDGIDAALVQISKDNSLKILQTHYTAFAGELQHALKQLCFRENVNLRLLGELDTRLGIQFADCINALLAKAQISASDISGIGSHGQTVFHAPQQPWPFTLQIGDPNRIARMTGITTVADFRRKDIAAGGQGAPLVPAFHQAVFQHQSENRAILNLGGIANITILPGKNRHEDVQGFDTGPANALLDYWIEAQQGISYDADGRWAATGKTNERLLSLLCEDDYFALAPPKSTGKEYFSGNWLGGKLAALGEKNISPADIQATLQTLTAKTVADSILQYPCGVQRLLVCGGGVHNRGLMTQLAELLPCPVQSTQEFAIDPDWVEAAAFAWLAKRRLDKMHGNIPFATGANSAEILGAVYSA